MRLRIRLLLSFGLLALALPWATWAQEKTAPPAGEAAHAGVIKSVRGEVLVLNLQNVARAAQPGQAVAATDRIVTGGDGGISVVLRDGTALVLGPQSRLDLRQFQFDATTREGGLLLSLLRGSLRMVSGLLGKTNPASVRVDTPTATIGIRGTDFIVMADAQQ